MLFIPIIKGEALNISVLNESCWGRDSSCDYPEYLCVIHHFSMPSTEFIPPQRDSVIGIL